jgi:hypothetical protein
MKVFLLALIGVLTLTGCSDDPNELREFSVYEIMRVVELHDKQLVQKPSQCSVVISYTDVGGWPHTNFVVHKKCYDGLTTTTQKIFGFNVTKPTVSRSDDLGMRYVFYRPLVLKHNGTHWVITNIPEIEQTKGV